MKSENIKIVQISSVHSSNDTRIFHKICQSLISNGYNVDLIIQHGKDELKQGVQIFALPISKKKIDRLFKIIPKLFVKSLKYPKGTIIHFHDSELIMIGLVLKVLGYKVIYDVHEDVPIDILTKEWIPRIFRRAISNTIEVLEKIADRYFDSIITVVPSISKRFKNKCSVEIRNYPIISDKTERLNLNKKEEESRYVVYVGSLTSRRGIGKIVDAIGYLENEVNVKLVLGGDFAEKGLREFLTNKKGWNNTRYIGWIDRTEINNILNGALAGLVVLGNIPTHRESLPVKMFEYMIAGIPVIASDFPLWREIIEKENCGMLVNPEKPEEIAKSIQWIVNNKQEAIKMGLRGQKAVMEKYNWSTEEKKLVELYKHLSIS